MSSKMPGKDTLSPTEQDVLCGRGEHGKLHTGNVLFRKLVNERKDEYTLPSTGRGRKNDIARDLYDQVREMGGRFLKRGGVRQQEGEARSGGGGGTGWVEVDEAAALEKCKQTLREKKERANLPCRHHSIMNSACSTWPRPPDVLFGRGEGSKRHEGNVRFREFVEERREEYTQATNQKEKSDIARGVYNQVYLMGGRFLAKKNDEDESCGWVEVDEMCALEKCKQTLRQNHEKRNSTRISHKDATHTIPTPQDVLCGRGEGGNSQVGNVRFRELVRERKSRYARSTNPNEKNSIARDIYMLIRDMGGRFLAREDAEGTRGWVEVDETCALEKCKQSLRQNKEKRNSLNNSVQFFRDGETQHERKPDSHLNGFFPTNPTTTIPARMLSDTEAFGAFFPGTYWPLQDQSIFSQMPYRDSLLAEQCLDSILSSTSGLDASVSDDGSSSEDPSVSNTDIFNFFIGHIIGDPSRPRFTEEQWQREVATLSQEERERILCDVYGRMSCTIHPNKRVRNEGDTYSIKQLVTAMRGEVKRISSTKKQALLEAQAKCSTEEFADSRLELFLRCEGMDPKLGAERFVRYWECRQKVFGPKKYTQRMMLSEALNDDLVALETGFVFLLPLLDTSGRQLLVNVPSRHSREGYTSESLLRAYWYVMEVCSRKNKHINGSVVTIGWLFGTTFLDHDQKVWDPIFEYERMCWPVKSLSTHCCCEASSLLVKMYKPRILAIMGKERRSRFILHALPKSEVVAALANFGILKHMLPRFMGGTLEFDQSDWIRRRRVAEMGEL